MKRLFKNIGALLLMAAALLMTSCARDYADDIQAADKGMNELKQADAELRSYLTTCISEARTRLNSKLNSESGRFTDKIANMVDSLKNDIALRMEHITNDMNGQFSEKESQAEQKIDEINNLINGENGVKSRLQKKLQDTEQAVNSHQNNNNQELAEKLEPYTQELKKLNDKVDTLDNVLNKWRSVLEANRSANWVEELNKIEGDIEALESFKDTEELDKMFDALKKFTEEEYYAMETEDLKKLKDFFNVADSLSELILNPLVTAKEKLHDYELDYDDYETGVSNMLSDLSSYDTSFSEIDDILAIEPTLDDIDGYIDDIETILGELDDIIDTIDGYTDRGQDIESQWDEACNTMIEYFGAGGVANNLCQKVEDAYTALWDWIEHLKTDYPWWDWD